MRSLDSFKRVKLAITPTPFYKLENISRELGKNIWIKRDDMTGVALGGNKVRKLEFLLADALGKGAKTVYTTGGAQSNHAMLTAACCLKLGITPVLLLKARGVQERRGNILLEWLMGVDTRFIDTDSYDEIYGLMDRLGKETGEEYYKIPCGGSTPLGSLGYIDCIRELAGQCKDIGLRPDRIVCATGSGGTHAGVAMGAHLYLPQTKVTGMVVDDQDFAPIVRELMKGSAELLELEDDIDAIPIDLQSAFGPGYALPSKAGERAIKLMAQKEGIILDPVYTGKTFGGILTALEQGLWQDEENIVFVFTGGAGGLFAIDF